MKRPAFTPPIAFALEQADWYVRPDLTTFLETPVLLRQVVQQPIPLELIQSAIDERVQQLGWTWEQRTDFVQALFEQPEAPLDRGDWELLLFELQSQLQGAD